MNTRNEDSFNKIRSACRSLLLLVFGVACIILLMSFCKIVAVNKIKMNRDFDNYYNEVEDSLNGFKKTSDALFADDDVKRFCNNLNGEYDIYTSVQAGKTVGTFQTFLTSGQQRIILTNLENDICVSGGGRTSLNAVREDLLLNDARITAITNNHTDKSFYFYDPESEVISIAFRHQYAKDGGSFYCFIIADADVLLPHENFIIANYGSRYQNKPSDANTIKSGKLYTKESVTIPGLFYEYRAGYDDILLIIFIGIFIILCAAGAFFSKKLAENILNAIYEPIITATGKNEKHKGAQRACSWDESAKNLIGDSRQMKSELKANSIYRKMNHLRSLLYDIEDYQERYIAEYDLEYLNNGCRVVLMDFAHKSDLTISRGRAFDDEFARELESVISQKISGEFVAVNNGRYVYITDVCDKEVLRKGFADVLEFAINCKMSALIAVGDKIEHLRELKSSFRNALDCAERKSTFPSHFIVFFSEIANEHSSFYYPIDVEVRLIENIVMGNREAVDEILSKVLARNLYEISLSAEKLRELKIVMVGTINRAINRMNRDVSDIFGENSSVYLEIGASRDKEEFAKSVRSVFGVLCSRTEIGNESKQDKIARDVMAYIEANFGDPNLSLDGIARIFFVSQNHVSRVLKNKIGKSYKEYVNDVRINEAKRLLKNTPMTVQNVANKVGYTDIRAFNRLFKKYTNQTPNEYRVTE